MVAGLAIPRAGWREQASGGAVPGPPGPGPPWASPAWVGTPRCVDVPDMGSGTPLNQAFLAPTQNLSTNRGLKQTLGSYLEGQKMCPAGRPAGLPPRAKEVAGVKTRDEV